MLSPRNALLAGAMLGMLVAPLAAAQPSTTSKIDRALRAALAAGQPTQRVIIAVAPGCRAAVRQALRQHGDVVRAEHPLIDALAADTHSGDVEALAAHPCVESVSSDADVYPTSDRRYSSISGGATNTRHPQRSPKSAPVNTLRETLGLPSVADAGANGSAGVGVVVIDSGIAPSADFTGRITAFYDFTRGGIATDPYDDYGHGTHVAGLIGSSGKLSREHQGIAPGVNLIALKVLDGTGRGRTSDVISALEFVVANRARLNAHVVNISLGHPIYAPARYDPLVEAVERASSAGLIVVVSGGNAGIDRKNGDPGYTGITSPGNAPSAITVGATMHQETVLRSDDVIAPYSSRGPTWFDAYAKPDVLAPGHRLVSDASRTSYLYDRLKENRGSPQGGHDFLRLSGTSMSAAVTSGVVALMLEQHQQSGFHGQRPMTANLVKAILQFSAIPLPGADHLTQGAGQINAAGANWLASHVDTGAAADALWLDAAAVFTSSIGGVSYAWSQHVIWDDQVLTGDLLYYNLRAWSVGAFGSDDIIWGTGDDIIWGNAALVDEDNIIWGTTDVWAANLVWSDRIVGLDDGDNIIWGTDDNIIWGTLDFENIIWGTWDGDNIIWGTWDGDNIIWGTDDDIIWGTRVLH